MLYLKRWGEQKACASNGDCNSVVLGTVDVNDAFFMVDQEIPMAVSLLGKMFKVCKNLPGQRLGAKACWSFRDILTKEFQMSWCPEQTTTLGTKQSLPYHVACGRCGVLR